jgi:putative transposase
MIRSFQYRAKLSKQSEAICVQWLEQCRILYNLALEQRIMVYQQSRKSFTGWDQMDQLPELKEGYPEFKQVHSLVLVDVLDRLDKAFKSFYRRCEQRNGNNVGFPRFKSANRYNSFTFTQSGWKLNDCYLHLSKLGKLKLFLSRPVEGRIKTVTVKRTVTGKWFVSFVCDNILPRIFPETNKEIGIDVGIKFFLVDSEGQKVDNPLFLKQSLNKLRVRNRRLCRRVKGSRRRNKARIQVAKTYEKITNQRKDFLHKTANYYIQNNKKIFIEDLNVSGMVQNKYLSRSIQDSSWGLFFQMLQYKAEEAGKEVVKVNPYGTSQNCSQCGEKVPKTLDIRIHRCPFCGCVLDRDHNAAINIKRLGQSRRTLTWDISVPCVVRESNTVEV